MNSTLDVGVVAVEEGAAGCGGMTWWSLSGSVGLEDLAEAWEAEGFHPDLLPTQPSPEAALHRAAADQAGKRMLCRPLKRGMWELRCEIVVDDGAAAPTLSHLFECRVELRPDGTPLVTPADHVLAKPILHAFNVYRTVLTADDLSVWLSTMARRERGIPLRERGGVYFIPGGEHVARWRKLARALRAASAHRVYEVPALRTDNAVEAILTALRHDAEEQLKVVADYLDQGPEGVSTRGLNAYGRKAEEVRAKLDYYAGLLGVALPDLRARTVDLAGALTAAKLLAKAS